MPWKTNLQVLGYTNNTFIFGYFLQLFLPNQGLVESCYVIKIFKLQQRRQTIQLCFIIFSNSNCFRNSVFDKKPFRSTALKLKSDSIQISCSLFSISLTCLRFCLYSLVKLLSTSAIVRGNFGLWWSSNSLIKFALSWYFRSSMSWLFLRFSLLRFAFRISSAR